MAEIDWDKIIKEAQSRKRKKKKDEDIEKRLDRMEKMLKKAVDSKDSKKAEDDYKDIVPEKPEASERDKLQKAGFKFVKVKKKSLPSVPNIRAERVKRIFSNRKTIAIIAICVVGSLCAMGIFSFNINPFAVFTPNATTTTTTVATMYVCPDGETVVNDTSLCPTTTTTTSTTTTTVPTTTTTLGASHSIDITEVSCSSNIITVTLKNTGPTVDNMGYVTFYVDGELDSTFLCAGAGLGPGEETSCVSGVVSSGAHDVEARGLVNVAYATVTC